MGTLTVRIRDDLEEELRKRAAQLYGARRGSLSKAIEEALRLWLSSSSRRESGATYRAYRGEKIVAEAGSLKELADVLRGMGEDLRGLRIVRLPAASRERRLGLRVRGREG